MAARIARLYRLIGRAGHVRLALSVALLVVERLLLAGGAIGLLRGSSLAWLAVVALITLWAVRGLLVQSVTREFRRRLTSTIAEAALASGGDARFTASSNGNEAVFEGRPAAEQVLMRHLPALVAETAAGLALLLIVRPEGIPIAVSVAAVATTTFVVLRFRGPTADLQKLAWRHYMAVAERTLIGIHAASEIVASGHVETFLHRLRQSIDDWSKAAARAERKMAVFQRLPFATILLLGAWLLAHAPSLRLDGALRLAVLLPPLAGVTRTAFEIIRSSPKLSSLEPFVLGPQGSTRGGRLPNGAAELCFERVSFGFGERSVLKDLSFSWKPGCAICVRGANGSGKSTLLKLALGLVHPQSGTITVGGIDMREVDLPTWRKDVSYLPQQAYVPEGFTVLETMQLLLPGLTKDNARAALDLTGAWDQLGRTSDGKTEPFDVKMSSLSVGARQRVLLARAFAHPARLTLLDEPDENLDQQARATLCQIVRSVDADRTIVIATHDETLLASATAIVDLGSA